MQVVKNKGICRISFRYTYPLLVYGEVGTNGEVGSNQVILLKCVCQDIASACVPGPCCLPSRHEHTNSHAVSFQALVPRASKKSFIKECTFNDNKKSYNMI